ncbi:myosin, essential light chain, adductor muscle-like [Physella acuta]|uniref:myosin, essential light chain, adductor muscle-like n=1 Tax=Physella acuta TaxID=109671 RepID=UPI0027DC5350|nr:myosin, essential light chain, adductor muscle-like [Physella acuta]
MATDLSRDEIEEIKDVFELFDFWDGRDGEVDAFKTGHMLYCLGLNPTLGTVKKNGGTDKLGEKAYKLEEFLPIFSAVSKEKDTGTFADFNEAFKTFDREGQGFISAAEMRHVLTCLGEKLKDAEVDEIIQATDTREDLEGNIKYEDFIQKILKGPYE